MLINPKQLAVEVRASVDEYTDLLNHDDAARRGSVVLSHATLRRSLPPSDGGGARERRHRGNNHSAATAPDSGPAYDTGRRAPLISPADLARCTVARPQRSARATARTLSPAARHRRVSPSRAARFTGAPVARSCPRFQPARFPPRHKRPSSGRQRQPGRRMPRQPGPPPTTPHSPGSRTSLTIMVKDSLAMIAPSGDRDRPFRA